MNIFINAAAMTPIRSKGQNETLMLSQVFDDLIKQYNVDPNSLQAVILSNLFGATSLRQASIKPQAWLRHLGIGPVPFYSIESACAGGSVGLDLGCRILEPGGNIMILGVEYLSYLPIESKLMGISQGVPEDEREQLKIDYGRMSEGTLFMGFNEFWGQYLLENNLATTEQFAATAAKSRFHGSLNPLATHRETLSIDEILSSRKVSSVLTVPMCSSFTDGAAGIIISTERTASSVKIRNCKSYSGNGTMEYHERLKQCVDHTVADAGMELKDFKCLEIHDATSVEELYSLETLEIFEEGEAGAHTLAGDTTLGGKGPIINPSGGLVSRGHPIGATGLCQIYELYLQLTGKAEQRQIDNLNSALAINTGGIISMDAASVGITILEKA